MFDALQMDETETNETKHDDMRLIKQAVLDCGKGIVATNAKIELLTEGIVRAIGDVTGQSMANVQTSLDNTLDRFKEQSDSAMAGFSEKAEEASVRLETRVDEGLTAYEDRLKKQVHALVEHLKIDEQSAKHRSDELYKRTGDLEISILEQLDKDQLALTDAMAGHSNALSDVLTKLNSDLQEAEAKRRKSIEMLVVLSCVNAIFGIAILCLLLFR
jgi:hypothetical protein